MHPGCCLSCWHTFSVRCTQVGWVEQMLGRAALPECHASMSHQGAHVAGRASHAADVCWPAFPCSRWTVMARQETQVSEHTNFFLPLCVADSRSLSGLLMVYVSYKASSTRSMHASIQQQ